MPLTLATFNVKDLFVPKSDEERLVYPLKVAVVADLLVRADADVVGLQEVGARDALREILDGVGRASARLRYGDDGLVLGAVDARGIGNALASRVSLLARETHTAQKLELPVFQRGDPSPFGARIPLRRAVVHAVVEGGAGLGPVHVFVLHFKSKLPALLRSETGAPVASATPKARAEAELRSLFFRSAEALYVRGLVDDVLARAPAAHVAVMGDFNDTIDGSAARILMAAGHRADEPLPGTLFGCADAIPVERRFTVLHGGAREQIDHILVTGGLRARLQDARILNEKLRDHGSFAESTAPQPDSDHAPFVARFA